MREDSDRHMDEHQHGQVQPPAPSEPSGREMEREVDRGVWGPGAFATRSQVVGGTVGTLVGGLLGLLIGFVLGMAFFGGEMLSVGIVAVVGAVAGSTALGTAGGFLWNRGRQERGEPDV